MATVREFFQKYGSKVSHQAGGAGKKYNFFFITIGEGEDVQDIQIFYKKELTKEVALDKPFKFYAEKNARFVMSGAEELTL